MSSEMRELVKEMRAGTPCYVAKVGGGRCVNGAECLRCAERLDWADRLERALLARTEARADGGAPICLFDATNPCDGTCGECHHLHASPKDAAPVADGAVATVHSSDTPGHFCIVTPSFPRGTKLYTRPQDASGDAEAAYAILDRLTTTRKGCMQLAKVIYRELDKVEKLLDEAVEKCAAMQAKEAK